MADRMEKRSPDLGGRGGWGLVVALALLLAVLGVVLLRKEPPAVQPASAPPTEFSGERALAVLRTLVGDGSPHPVGSPANAAVRDRVIAELQKIGYAPQVQRAFVCSPLGGGTCGWVENVVARLEGTARDGSILLMAHYDSVGAGPGVSDDLAGTAAVLETARALKAGPAPKNPVIFLIDDGEEAGLLGAQAFSDSPLDDDVKVVVNLEARGTRGRSLMFETIGNDGWLVPLYAGGTSRPVTSSVFVTIYELLPNNTDLTVYKARKDVDGLNFAYLENPTHYHTPLDNLESLDPASLQHHGDNALGAVRRLAHADLAHRPQGDAVFFDVLGWTVVHWPKSWTLPIALLVLALTLVVFWKGRAGGRVTVGGLFVGLGAFLALLVVSGAFAFGLTMVLNGLLPAQWIDRWAPLVAAFWALPVLVAALLIPALGRRAGLAGLFSGVWLGWALFGVALAVMVPGTSYLFLVPGLIAGIAGLALVRGGSPVTGAVAVMLPVLVGGVLWFPILLALYAGLGSGSLVPVAVLRAILLAGLAPLFLAARPAARWLVAGASLLVVVGGLGLAASAPVYSEASPQPAVVHYHFDADAGKGRWIVLSAPPFPAGFRQAAPFGEKPEPTYPWAPKQVAFQAPAPALAVPAPEVTVVEQAALPGGKRRVLLRITSPRGAGLVTLYIPQEAGLESITRAGREVKVSFFGASGFSSLRVGPLTPEGEDFEAVVGAAPQDWWVMDQSSGLPAGGEALQKARPATAVPFQDGDVTRVSRKARI
ncbi:MAG TPA: hypothetical protein DD490_12750 [Acidobacteria bacterium]|nr:hypothetical protein [Acidobacteriota bacterium]